MTEEQSRQQQIRERAHRTSPFVSDVDNFSDYIRKEYFEDSDGMKSLCIIAADRQGLPEDECTILNTAYGNGELLERGFVSAMKNPGLRSMFRRTALSVFEHELQAEIVDRRRRRVSKNLFLIAACFVWLAVLIFSSIAVGAHWTSTVSNVVVVAVSVYVLSCDMMFNRHLIRRYGSIVREDRYEKCKYVLSRIADAARLRLRRLRDEEDDDDE